MMGLNEDALDRIRNNPFYILGIRPTATRTEVEREGQKLLGMLELKLASATTYPTPVGLGVRTADKVRQAMALLRDPDTRLMHELWARLDPGSWPQDDRWQGDIDGFSSSNVADDDPLAPWPDALSALGWRAK